MAQSDAADNAGVRILPPLVYLAGLVLGYAVWWFWPMPVVPDAWSFALRIAGGVAFLLGIWLVAAAVMHFSRIGEDPNPTVPTHTLTFDGPYRFTRNPMYLGLALIQGGLALLGNALWPLVALIPVIWIIRTQVIAKEELYLERKFGGEYTAFKARVRRWL